MTVSKRCLFQGTAWAGVGSGRNSIEQTKTKYLFQGNDSFELFFKFHLCSPKIRGCSSRKFLKWIIQRDYIAGHQLLSINSKICCTRQTLDIFTCLCFTDVKKGGGTRLQMSMCLAVNQTRTENLKWFKMILQWTLDSFLLLAVNKGEICWGDLFTPWRLFDLEYNNIFQSSTHLNHHNLSSHIHFQPCPILCNC